MIIFQIDSIVLLATSKIGLIPMSALIWCVLTREAYIIQYTAK